MKETLLWVDVKYACYGLVVSDQRVMDAPPVARWMIGKDESYVRQWLGGKGARIVDVDKLRQGIIDELS